jgi:putative ABC transport system substrate-binding protein
LLVWGAQVLVTSGTPALVAAAQATQSVPIVAGGPNRSLQDLKLVDSLARPGRNVTGLEPHPGLDAKGVELLAQTVPGLTRVGYMRNQATPGGAEQAARAGTAARALSLDFLELAVRAPDEIDAGLESAEAARVGGLVVQGDFLFGDPSGWRVVQLALAHRLPTVYTQTAGYVDQGGLMAYASDYNAFHRRAASLVDKLLRGVSAADLPVEQTTTFDFVINLRTAEALRLSIPQHVLVQATQVIR